MDERSGLVEQLEHRIQHRVVLSTNEDESLPRCNQQEGSPLFAMLPRELRDHIWQYATAPFEDDTQKFDETAYYYRPGHTACLKTDFALLLLCRRTWLEAHAMPMLQAEHSFYYHRAAPDRKDPAWMAKLTDHNRQNMGQLRLYAQMYVIERLRSEPGSLRMFFLEGLYTPNDFQPRMLHVTIRHTDWWNWESEERLRLKMSWVMALLNSPDLRSTEILKLELETLDYKVNQLQPILEQIQSLVSEDLATHWIDDKPASTCFVLTNDPEVYTWEGPADINNQHFRPYAGRARLKYHVVTLTWKLRFVEYPGGFVPRLRRAPRINLGPGAVSQVNLDPGAISRRMTVLGEDSMYMVVVPPGRPKQKKTLTRGGGRQMAATWSHDQQRVDWQIYRLAQRQAGVAESTRRAQFEELMSSYERNMPLVECEMWNTLLKQEEGFPPRDLLARRS